MFRTVTKSDELDIFLHICARCLKFARRLVCFYPVTVSHQQMTTACAAHVKLFRGSRYIVRNVTHATQRERKHVDHLEAHEPVYCSYTRRSFTRKSKSIECKRRSPHVEYAKK